MKSNLTIIITLCSIFTMAGSFAAENKEPVMFEDIDSDADGCITKSEAKARKDLYKNFKMADTDKSGTVCVDEYTIFHNKGRMEIEEVEVPEVGAAPVK